MLLEPEEQARIKGLIMNKFRGDKKILDPGITMLEERAGKPVLGVVPYADVDIEDEDSLASSLEETHIQAEIDVAVIRFPRISNFTDMQALSMERDVSVRYVTKPSELGEPDVILLPGTKNTIQDLLWLRESGLETKITRLAKKGTIVFGICGGYQMLGESLMDPLQTESALGSVRGMGLLPVTTVFEEEKQLENRAYRIGMLEGILCHSAIRKLPVMRYTWGGRKLLAKLKPHLSFRQRFSRNRTRLHGRNCGRQLYSRHLR